MRWPWRKGTLSEQAERETRRMRKVVKRHGFERSEGTGSRLTPQGVYLHPVTGRRIVLTTIDGYGQCEAEISDRRRRPDVKLAYSVADLEGVLTTW